MSIIYALVAKDGDTVLSNGQIASGNFPQVTQSILGKIQPNKQCSLTYNSHYMFHYISKGDLTVLCLSETDYKISLAKVFLQQLRKQFMERYPEHKIEKAYAYSMKKFNKEIEKLIKHYNSDKVDKYKACLNEVNKLKNQTLDNINKLLEREEKVEILVQKTKSMNIESMGLKRRARKIRDVERWKDRKFKLLIFGVLVILVWIGLSYVCGGFGMGECFGQDYYDPEEEKLENGGSGE